MPYSFPILFPRNVHFQQQNNYPQNMMKMLRVPKKQEKILKLHYFVNFCHKFKLGHNFPTKSSGILVVKIYHITILDDSVLKGKNRSKKHPIEKYREKIHPFAIQKQSLCTLSRFFSLFFRKYHVLCPTSGEKCA